MFDSNIHIGECNEDKNIGEEKIMDLLIIIMMMDLCRMENFTTCD